MALDQIDMRLIDKVTTENDELKAEKEKLLSLIDDMKHASNDLEAKLQSTQSKLDEALEVMKYTLWQLERLGHLSNVNLVETLRELLQKLQGKDPATGGDR